jgi:CHAT domain-containing protein
VTWRVSLIGSALALCAPIARASLAQESAVAAASSSRTEEAMRLERELDQVRERFLSGEPAPGDDEIEGFAAATLRCAFLDPAAISLSRIEDGRAATARRAEFRTEYLLGYETDVASAYAQAGKLDTAADTVATALERFRDAAILRPRALNVIADVERARGHWDDALRRLAECEAARHPDYAALQIAERCQRHCVAAQLALDMGLPDRAGRELELAREVLDRGDWSASDPLPLEFEVLRCTAGLYATTDRQDALIDRLEERLAVAGFAERVPNFRVKALVLLGAAMCDPASKPREVRIAEGSFRDGAELLRRALADPATDAEWRRIALKNLVERHLTRGEVDAARRYFEELSAAIARDSADSPGAWRERALAACFALRLARADERTRSKEELAKRVDELDRAAGEWLRRLAELPARPGGLGLLHYTVNRAILAELLLGRLVDAATETSERDAWRALEAAQLLGSLTRLCRAPSCELERFRREYLRERHGLLVFLPAHPNSVVLAIDRERIDIDRIAQEDELEAARKRLSSILSTPPTASVGPDEKLESARKRLAALLFTPAVQARMEGWDRVTILGSELHENVPFECLPWRDGEILGLTKAVDTLPSAPLGPLLRARYPTTEKPAQDAVLVLAAPKPGPATAGLPAIPWSGERSRAKAELYPAGVVRIAIGEEATVEALRSPAVASARVLEIVAHGKFEPARERPAHLLLAPTDRSDGRLWCESVDGFGADGGIAPVRAPRIVILAACGAARDQKRYGEDGVSNLGGAFLFAGAQCVLISRYDVELAAAERMTSVVHRRLQLGDSCAEAMRRARAELAEDPAFAHPFYWSALQVFGDGQCAVFR